MCARIPKSVTDTAILNLPRGAPSIHRGIKFPPHHSPLSLPATFTVAAPLRSRTLEMNGNWPLPSLALRLVWIQGQADPSHSLRMGRRLNRVIINASAHVPVRSCSSVWDGRGCAVYKFISVKTTDDVVLDRRTISRWHRDVIHTLRVLAAINQSENIT